jgi:hypothetical protein
MASSKTLVLTARGVDDQRLTIVRDKLSMTTCLRRIHAPSR